MPCRLSFILSSFLPNVLNVPTIILFLWIWPAILPLLLVSIGYFAVILFLLSDAKLRAINEDLTKQNGRLQEKGKF